MWKRKKNFVISNRGKNYYWFNEIDFKLNLTRAKFEYICKDKFDLIIKPIEEGLKVSKLNKNDINEVLFVGGSSRMPRIEAKFWSISKYKNK